MTGGVFVNEAWQTYVQIRVGCHYRFMQALCSPMKARLM